MAKDPDKYLYITIGLLRGSDAEQRFLADARRNHMVEHPGKLAGIRLTEFYELLETGLLSPALLAALGSKGVQIQATPVEPKTREESNGDLLRISNEADSNAEEAGEYWNPL
jgi:hypothetical protein